ncbi:hypothetical protein B0H12DRAFT_1076642 [Mycena haematopus]|nr:hypothetical protein B0H12DRAFT_1076642 [Mycena haematopus]
MCSLWSFRTLIDRLKSSDLVLMAEASYSVDFEPTCQPDGSSSQRFIPVIFGEVKEITSRDCLPMGAHPSLSVQGPYFLSATLSLGLPTCAPNLIDTFYWNQLAALDYAVRRESAENDCLLPDVAAGQDHVGYIKNRQLVPWTLGPSGLPTDRVFIRISADCTVLRRLPSQVSFPLSPELLELPGSPRALLADSYDVVSAIGAIPFTAAAPCYDDDIADGDRVDSGASTDSDDSDSDDPDLVSWRSLRIGDLVVARCELFRADYDEGGKYTTVYVLNARGVNVVV